MSNQNELIEKLRDLASRKITYPMFLESLSGEFCDDDESISRQLQRALAERDEIILDVALAILAYEIRERRISDEVARLLCDVLMEDWHRVREDVAFTLEQIASPQTVDCLFRGAQLTPTEVDEWNQLARKCIKGLARIGTPEALSKLESLSMNSDPRVCEYALKELRRKK